MKRLLCMTLWIFLIFTFLAGCSNPLPAATMPEPETTAPTEWIMEAEETEKLYRGKELRLLPIWQADAPEAAVLTQAAEVFEFQTGCRVEILWEAEEEENADILQLPGGELEDYRDRVANLTDMAEAAGYAEKSFQYLTEQVISRCGFLGAIPQSPSVTGFYYSVEAFETSGVIQPPADWERFLSVCTLLRSGGYQPLTFDAEQADDLLQMYLIQYMGMEAATDLMDNGGWKSENILTAVTYISDFVLGGNLTTGTPAGTNRVATSNGAIAYGTNTLCAKAEQAALARLNWGLFPYPGVNGSEPFITVTADVLAISGDCQEPQAAFDFIMLLTTGEFDQLRADVTIGIPADPANTSPIEGALEALTGARILEVSDPGLTEKQCAYIRNLWRGKYELVETFLKDMQKHY